MKNLNCIFKNIFSSDRRFIFNTEAGNNDTQPAAKDDKPKDPADAYLPPVENDELLSEYRAKNEDEAKRQAEEMFSRAVQKGAHVDDEWKDPFEAKNMSIADLRKMDSSNLRKLFLKPTKPEVGEYSVDFQGNQVAQNKIGLQNLFGEKNPLVLVEKKSFDEGFYAERGKDGFYYQPGTDKRVTIFTGDKVTIPVNPEQVAAFNVEVADYKKEKIRLAQAEKTKIKREQVVNAILQYKPDFNMKRDNDLFKSVFGYLTKNPSMTESHLVAMSAYADMPKENKDALNAALKEKGYESNIRNTDTLNMMVRLMDEYSKHQASKTKEMWAKLIPDNSGKHQGPIFAQN